MTSTAFPAVALLMTGQPMECTNSIAFLITESLNFVALEPRADLSVLLPPER
jgi:hypothetical protein